MSADGKPNAKDVMAAALEMALEAAKKAGNEPPEDVRERLEAWRRLFGQVPS